MDSNVKKTIIGKILEEWYTIDSILFNTHARNIINNGDIYKEYVSLKAGMLENLFEYYCYVGMVPKFSNPKTIRQLVESAVISAKKAKKTAVGIINKESTKKRIKDKVIKEARKLNISDLDKLSDKIIQEKLIQYALDNALIGIPLVESKRIDTGCDTFKCKLLEESHRTYRDSLIHLAFGCKKLSK
jgi:ATP-dependent protease HslVU (ClpYQ) ATPase subunit